MSCPTCDHTMQRLPLHIFWCPRCGTLKTPGEREEAPKLVERCREFAIVIYPIAPANFMSNLNSVQTAFAEAVIQSIYARWAQMGIAESINVPSERPQ